MGNRLKVCLFSVRLGYTKPQSESAADQLLGGSQVNMQDLARYRCLEVLDLTLLPNRID